MDVGDEETDKQPHSLTENFSKNPDENSQRSRRARLAQSCCVLPFASASRASADSPPLGRQAVTPEGKLVENTGLEPVTSWLQTRRSPS